MIAVGDQCRASDLLADPDAEDRDHLVAQEADDGREGDGPEVLDRPGVEQAVHRLVPRDPRAEQDGQHDGQSGEVFHPAVPIVKTPVGWPPGEKEGDAQRDSRRGVAEVVDGVGQQGHAVRQEHDHQLDRRGDEQAQERPLDRPQPTLVREHGRIDAAVLVPRMVVVVPVRIVGWVMMAAHHVSSLSGGAARVRRSGRLSKQ